MSRNKEFDFDCLSEVSKDVYELRLKAPDLTRLAGVVRTTCGDTISLRTRFLTPSQRGWMATRCRSPSWR